MKGNDLESSLKIFLEKKNVSLVWANHSSPHGCFKGYVYLHFFEYIYIYIYIVNFGHIEYVKLISLQIEYFIYKKVIPTSR